MRRINLIAVSMAATMISAAYAAPQPEALVQQLRAAYPDTVLDSNGLKVVKPGATLVVQTDGMYANPMKSGAFGNTFADGHFVRTETKSEKAARFGISVPQKRASERPVATGAKVYLLNKEFSSDAIVFVVETCGDCDPKSVDPGYERYRAKVTFKFVHGALGETDLKHVQQTIEQVFKFAEAPAPPVETAPPPPPLPAPPPPVETKPRVLKLGMTMKQVKDGFGEPASIVDLGNKVIYVYKDQKVTFVNGKVSDVDVR